MKSLEKQKLPKSRKLEQKKRNLKKAGLKLIEIVSQSGFLTSSSTNYSE